MSATIEVPTVDEFLRVMREVRTEDMRDVYERLGERLPASEEFDAIDELVRQYEREQPHLVAPDQSAEYHNVNDIIGYQRGQWWWKAYEQIVGP